ILLGLGSLRGARRIPAACDIETEIDERPVNARGARREQLTLCGEWDGLGRPLGLRLRWLALQAWQPLEPARQVPVRLAEELHRRRQEDGADESRVDQHRCCEADAISFMSMISPPTASAAGQ